MSGDPDDLSQFVQRNAFRRVRVSHGLTAGLPKDMPRERIHCKQCRKYITYKQVYTVWEFVPDRAWRMRCCKYCHTVVQEKEFDLSKGGEEEWSVKDVMQRLVQSLTSRP